MDRTNQSAKTYKWVSLAFLLVLCLGTGFAGSLATQTSIESWYLYLKKPFGNPPDWVFAPVWTVLYVLMAVAAWRIWQLRARTAVKQAFTLFAVQLGLNALWSPVFFGFQNPGLALSVILALWAAVFSTQRTFQALDPAAGVLFLPYRAWVTYAVYLNAGIWWLNR